MDSKSPGRGRHRSLPVRHHPESIHRKIRKTFFLMIAVPFCIVLVATAVVGRIYFGKTFSPGPGNGHNAFDSVPDPSDIRKLNALLAENPESLFGSDTLGVFYKDRPRRFAISYKNGIMAAVSNPVTPETYETLKTEKIRNKDRLVQAWEWDFTWTDETGKDAAGKIMFYADRQSLHGGPFWFLIMLVVILVTVNFIASRRISRHITGPLEKLEQAAVRIGDGDLDFRLQPQGAEEVNRLCSAFEEMRKRLKASLEKQEEQDNSRKELIAAISHDLRTPITSIRGHVEGLKDNIPKTEAARKKYLDIIEQQALVLDDMIHNLFLFSKLEIGEIPLNKEETLLSDFVSTAVGEYLQIKYPAGKGGTAAPDVSVNIPEPVFCFIDKKQFKRVIVNIIENSIMYNPGGGLKINVSAEEERGTVRILISDNGSGINPENEKRIFETMFREDESRNREGSGLGLTIVDKLVAAHGGTVKAYNNTDGTSGLTVEITLASFAGTGGRT